VLPFEILAGLKPAFEPVVLIAAQAINDHESVLG
jgi:hypothetical protein